MSANTRSRDRSRAGVAVVLVLAILAITLTVSYAVLRTQTTSVWVEANHIRLDDARSAAMSGISAALRKIHTSSWAGVGTQLTGRLDNGASYVVDFIAGDANLNPGDEEYDLLPYRVTLRSTGTSTSSDGSSSVSEHVIEVVVQLVPRTLQSTSPQWEKVQSYTLYQWQNQPVTFDLPAQIGGKVHSQGTLSFMPTFPTSTRYPFTGYIDEVAIYDKTLSALDVTAIYAASLLGDPTSLYLSHRPFAYWKLNEATGAVNATDSAGGNTGLYISSKPGQTDKPFTTASTSTLFDGLNDHVDCGQFVISSNKISVLAWIKPTALTSDMRIVSQGVGPTDDEQYWKMGIERVSSNYRALFAVRVNNNYSECIMNAGTLLPNLWYFVVGTFDGSQTKLYLNGVLQRTSGSNGSLTTNANACITIGDAPPGCPHTRLLHDYYQMHQDKVADYRPLIQSWEAPSGKVSSTYSNLLQDDLKVTVSTAGTDNTAPVTFPVSGSSYQLFPGGPIYSIPSISSDLQNTRLLPDPESNPLGIFDCSTDLRIRNDVTIQGTIIVRGTSGELRIDDEDNVRWTPVDLKTLPDETLPRQLPVAIVPERFVLRECKGVNITGQIVAGNKFEFEATDEAVDVKIQGSCVCGKFNVYEDKTWPTTSSAWNSHLQSFLQQRTTGIAYFPEWLNSNQSIATAPRIAITPENTDRLYHWPDFLQAIFQPHPSDPGMRWQVVSWNDRS